MPRPIDTTAMGLVSEDNDGFLVSVFGGWQLFGQLRSVRVSVHEKELRAERAELLPARTAL